MGCTQYEPLISRYLDDDLEKKELEGLLEHLFECEECQREMKAYEDLRSSFQALKFSDIPPEPSKAFVLDDLLLETEFSGEDRVAGPPIPEKLLEMDWHVDKQKEPEKSSWIAPLQKVFFPKNVLRFAVPMVAVIVLGVWMYPAEPENQIDVRQLPTSQSLSTHLSKQNVDAENTDLYVMHHAAHQPWVHYGNETPMVQKVSTTNP